MGAALRNRPQAEPVMIVFITRRPNRNIAIPDSFGYTAQVCREEKECELAWGLSAQSVNDADPKGNRSGVVQSLIAT